MPTILNAANEVAVEAFMAGRIGFFDIARLVEATCDASAARHRDAPATVEDALAIDTGCARDRARASAAGRFGFALNT